MGLARLFREGAGCGVGAELGDGVPAAAGLWAGDSGFGWVDRLHSMPWRTQARQDGRVSSHWEQRVGQSAAGIASTEGVMT